MRSVFGIVLHLGECMICREGGGCADDAAGCDLAGRYALGGLGQRCGELKAPLWCPSRTDAVLLHKIDICCVTASDIILHKCRSFVLILRVFPVLQFPVLSARVFFVRFGW